MQVLTWLTCFWVRSSTSSDAVSGKQALSQITSNKTWFPWRSHPALQVLPSPASMDKSDNYFRFMESENSGGHSLINTNIVTDLLYLSWGVVCFDLF